MERKNPLALIQAYQESKVFSESVLLLIKTKNAEHYPELAYELEQNSKFHSGIKLINENWSKELLLNTIANATAYVSLHRAEGFGMNMFDSLSLGVPTIATNYSGNLDFMHDFNSFLVDYEETSIENSHSLYFAQEEKWANPNLHNAAELINEVVKNKDLVLKKLRNNELYMSSVYSLEKVSTIIQNLIK
jgi:glycosyltransferase involved in cell wall biosynthesis